MISGDEGEGVTPPAPPVGVDFSVVAGESAEGGGAEGGLGSARCSWSRIWATYASSSMRQRQGPMLNAGAQWNLRRLLAR